MGDETLFRIVRHLGNGSREVLVEGLAMSNEQVADFNREHVRGMLRCWPITALSPMRKDAGLNTSGQPFDFTGVCDVCGELVAGEGARHKECNTSGQEGGRRG